MKIPDKVEELAKSNKVSIRSHNVIYKLVDDLKKEISSRLPFKDVEEVLGKKECIDEPCCSLIIIWFFFQLIAVYVFRYTVNVYVFSCALSWNTAKC